MDISQVIGVISAGSFLGLFSLDSIVVMPLPLFKSIHAKSDSDILVKVKDKQTG